MSTNLHDMTRYYYEVRYVRRGGTNHPVLGVFDDRYLAREDAQYVANRDQVRVGVYAVERATGKAIRIEAWEPLPPTR